MVVIIMGVSGCGKTTVGQLLAERLNLPYFDADDFHPESNVNKMESGIPLNDEDRWPWLENLNRSIREWNQDSGAVLACSALKKSYRDVLRRDTGKDGVTFVFLKGSKALISERLENRSGHYMPPELLDSQFEALEEPQHAITVSIKPKPAQIVDRILQELGTHYFKK